MNRDISPAIALVIATTSVCAVLAHPAAATAQVTFTSTTTINGNISIYGRDILPLKPASVPLRRVKVTLYLYETCFEFEACRDSVHAIGWIADANGDRLHDFTDDEGNFTITWQAEQRMAVEPLDLALEITLEHEEGLLQSRDKERSNDDTACMITAGFRINRGDTVDANIQMNIGTSNDTDYHARSIGFSPSSVEGSCFENAALTDDGPEISWVPMVGISNVGGDRFAHHAVLYERTLDAALFARDVLGETGLPMATVQGWDTGIGPTPRTSGKSFGCPRTFIRVPPAESPLTNSVSAAANIVGMRHEYGHLVHCFSPMSGTGSVGSVASAGNHANLANDDSGDSWTEGFATYFAAALAESLGESNPELQETRTGVLDLWDGGARIDQATVAGWAASAGAQMTNGALAEEMMIASFLWEVHVNIGGDVLWRILRANDPDLQTFLEVHDILANDGIAAMRFATRTCNIPASGGEGAGLDCLFINRGVYHDQDGDGLFDTGESVGVTRWPPEIRDATVFRRDVPVIPGSEMLLTVVDAAGTALADASLEISIEYDPPRQSSNFQYLRQLTGPPPYRIPILVPGNPSRATVRALKAGYETITGPVVDWEVFHDLINPFRPGGVADSLLSHEFVLPSTVASSNRSPIAVNDTYSVWTGAALRVDGPGVLANDADPDDDGLSATLVTPPAHGSFALAPDGSFTFAPPPGFTGEVTFIYRANDGHSTPVNAEVRIRVDPRPQLDYLFGDGRTEAVARDTWRLELRCDGAPGFFEFVNGSNGDKFRLVAMTSLICVDDPVIPNLPGMTYDTLSLVGAGKWNGRTDVEIRATISDSSRNAGADSLTIAITHDGTTVVARTLTGGTHTARSKPRR